MTKVKGLDGWLILPIIGFAYGLLLSIGFLAESFSTSDSFLAIFSIVGIFLYGNTLRLIFKENLYAPIWAIISLWYSPIIGVSISLMLGETFQFRYVIAAIIWTAYFLNSKRVKNTFVLVT